MPYKVTWFFNLNAQGWSSTLYYNATLTLPTDGTLPPPVQTLGQAMWRCSQNPTNWIGTRVSDMNNPRQTLTVSGNRVNPVSDTPDYPTNCGLAICKGANNVGIRQLWLHGVSDDSIYYDTAQNTFVIGAALQGAFNNLKNAILGDLWCLQTVNKGGVKNGATQINLVSPLASGDGVTINAALAGTGPTTTIIVGGFKYPLQKLNGTYLPGSGWIQTGGNNFVLLNRSIGTSAATNYPGGASVRIATKTLTKINSVNLEFVRERRVGRAFFVPRGRRSSK